MQCDWQVRGSIQDKGEGEQHDTSPPGTNPISSSARQCSTHELLYLSAGRRLAKRSGEESRLWMALRTWRGRPADCQHGSCSAKKRDERVVQIRENIRNSIWVTGFAETCEDTQKWSAWFKVHRMLDTQEDCWLYVWRQIQVKGLQTSRKWVVPRALLWSRFHTVTTGEA